MNHFKGKQFNNDVIIVAVGYYLRYNLSYREVQELLYDRGINFIKVSVQPLPRLRAWRPFEEYIKRTEEVERSSAFRCLLKSRY